MTTNTIGNIFHFLLFIKALMYYFQRRSDEKLSGHIHISTFLDTVKVQCLPFEFSFFQKKSLEVILCNFTLVMKRNGVIIHTPFKL